MSKISINTKNVIGETAPDLYGVFFEDISHAGDGGLYPEMIRNRSFEDSIIPDGCTTNDGGRTFVSPTGWIDEFNNGEGMTDWVNKGKILPTPVPGWYTDGADMSLFENDTLNEHRRVSLKVSFQKGGLLRNIGYGGVPQELGRKYNFYMFAKVVDPVELKIFIRSARTQTESFSVKITGEGWNRYDLSLTAVETCGDAEFVIESECEGSILIGFSSLMPADTFKNHGLRKDIAEKLAAINPAFLRFPGGCIVEGFTMETAMLFKKTVGPVWERPSWWLLWHYRTTNGLGFHEYLQLCEDLDLSALYVCNCGMTCQGRGPYFFNDEEMQMVIDDTLAALEYALGDADSEWGSLRAAMGHEAPFSLKYLEIGNENSGDEYEIRYEKIRQAVLYKYPEMIIIANDRSSALKTDIVDDHYYNMPEFYAENVGIYDKYDRSKPNIFVGEFAVNQTYEGQLRAAVAEAMFMVGFERNPDVVKLCSYAPLLEHVNYFSWYPNLIIYDNYRSYGIPSYYVWCLFGRNRGDRLVDFTEDTAKIYRECHGLPMVSGDFGLKYRNAVYNGVNVRPKKNIYGKITEKDGIMTLVEDPDTMEKPWFAIPGAVALGEDVESREGDFDIEMFMEEGKEVGVGMLCAPKPFSFYDRNNPNPRDPWMLFNLEPLRWMFKDGKATLMRGGIRLEPMAESMDVKIRYGEFNKIRYELGATHVKLYFNGELIQTVELPNYPSMCSVVTESSDEVIVKIVNFADKEDNISITLDIPVENKYIAEVLTGEADAENSLENPENVRDRISQREMCRDNFVYKAPALSVNVLRLKKRRVPLSCVVRAAGDTSEKYIPAESAGISYDIEEMGKTEIKTTYKVTVSNKGDESFNGVIQFKAGMDADNPKFFMPGYMYNRNTADMVYPGRKAFPRIKKGADTKPESEFFMTRADRLALPISLIYDSGRVIGVEAAPYLKNPDNGEFIKYCGFSCNINDEGRSSVGYTLGYENAPWLFVQSATVLEREPITEKNDFALAAGESYSFEVSVYDYDGYDEMAVYTAIEDAYRENHESPRQIPGMDAKKAVSLLSSAIRDYAWLEDEHFYTGFVYDLEDGLAYNKIPSVSWTNGLAIAVPMLMAADKLNDEKAREQSLIFIDETVKNRVNPRSGFLFESEADGVPTVRGWWYDGMRNGGHSAYINGQAVYYILKAYRTEKELRGIEHADWLELSGEIVHRMNETLDTDFEYPFAVSSENGRGIEYDSMGGAWFLAASAMYELVSGDRTFMKLLIKSEEHYYNAFVKKVECYGGPLDTDKAVDDEGILSFIRAVRILHEITGLEIFLDHLRDALSFEFTFKLGYNTVIHVRPLSEIGWSSCGGSITSTANPHIHPMSSAVIDEMDYYLSFRDDPYVKSRRDDTVGWSLQTFNTFDKEYGYGFPGWMSERFCFCEGLLTEKYPDGEPASTWFALMPWASSCIIEGLLCILP